MKVAAAPRLEIVGKPAGAPILRLDGITKSFGSAKVLEGVSFEIWPGEVHMLLGENGAGKSTLMKILCGIYQADEGSFVNCDQPTAAIGPDKAASPGVAVIFQEFSLVPHLDVVQNIFLGREVPSRIPGLVDRRTMEQKASSLLRLIGLEVDLRTPVHRLAVAQQQMVEIAKALSQEARILVMDEPTAALSDREASHLFQMIDRLKSTGVGIVYITHRMPEVFELGDRITVLRDGRVVGTAVPDQISSTELIEMMVGRPLKVQRRARARHAGEVVLDLSNVSSRNGIHNITMHVRRGEVVGLCGLVGSGRTEVARAIAGADPIKNGIVRLFGGVAAGTTSAAAKSGLGFVPEDRKRQGLSLRRTVGDNIISAALPKLFPWFVVSPARSQQVASTLVGRLGINCRSPHQLAGQLSGGNQQKVVIGKWLAAEAQLFLFDEPTRGVDIAAKSEIFNLIEGLVEQGAAVLMISSEQSEIVSISDRAYVMRGGTIVGELAGDDLTESSIVALGVHQ